MADLPEESAAAPADALAAIRQTQEHVQARTRPSTSVMFTVWGLAWVIAYTALFVGYDPAGQTPAGWSLLVLGICVVAAMVFTAVHIARRTYGIRGTSARVGAMYGWAWMLSFVFACVIFGAAGAAGAPPLVMSILTNSVSILIVAALYMAGGAIWQEWRMFALGVWFALVGSASAIVTPPHGYLVQAIAGGGGFLVGAAVAVIVTRRRSR